MFIVRFKFEVSIKDVSKLEPIQYRIFRPMLPMLMIRVMTNVMMSLMIRVNHRKEKKLHILFPCQFPLFKVSLIVM